MDKKVIESIVNDIADDISGRSGLGNEWDMIDEDIIEEIKTSWELIIKQNLNKDYM